MPVRQLVSTYGASEVIKELLGCLDGGRDGGCLTRASALEMLAAMRDEADLVYAAVLEKFGAYDAVDTVGLLGDLAPWLSADNEHIDDIIWSLIAADLEKNGMGLGGARVRHLTRLAERAKARSEVRGISDVLALLKTAKAGDPYQREAALESLIWMVPSAATRSVVVDTLNELLKNEPGASVVGSVRVSATIALVVWSGADLVPTEMIEYVVDNGSVSDIVRVLDGMDKGQSKGRGLIISTSLRSDDSRRIVAALDAVARLEDGAKRYRSVIEVLTEHKNPLVAERAKALAR